MKMTPELRAAVLATREHTAKPAGYAAKPAGYAAKPYTDALLQVPMGESRFHEDTVADMVLYLKSNLKTWRGALATEVKADLADFLSSDRRARA